MRRGAYRPAWSGERGRCVVSVDGSRPFDASVRRMATVSSWVSTIIARSFLCLPLPVTHLLIFQPVFLAGLPVGLDLFLTWHNMAMFSILALLALQKGSIDQNPHPLDLCPNSSLAFSYSGGQSLSLARARDEQSTM